MLEFARPEARGHTIGEALVERGRARRWTAEDGYELWRLADTDSAIAERLLRLGARNVGGFVGGGEDDEGPWLVRRGGARRLADLLRERGGPWPCRESLTLVSALARGQAAAEAASLFVGALTPDAVSWEEARVWLPSEGYVSALVGARGGAGQLFATASVEWMAPECADQTGWNNAANRYALGLILYRLLGGEHPFRGGGLRHALAGARVDPPPFRDDISLGMTPGLQAFCLRLVAPELGKRPTRAAEIVAEIEDFLDAHLSAKPLDAASVSEMGSSRASGNARPSSEPQRMGAPTALGGPLAIVTAKEIGNSTPAGAAKEIGNSTPAGSIKEIGNSTPAGAAKEIGNSTPAGAAKEIGNSNETGTSPALGSPPAIGSLERAGKPTETGNSPREGAAPVAHRGAPGDARTPPIGGRAENRDADKARPAASGSTSWIARFGRDAWLRGGAAAKRVLPYLPAVLLVAIAIGFASLDDDAAPPKRVSIQPARPVSALATSAQDCGACHPREVAEWRDSVMAHAAKSPLFNSLELLIEEQIGRDRDCPEGAGVLRRAGADACRDPTSGALVTGAGGEHWCINCHAPGENLASTVRPWSGRAGGRRDRLSVVEAVSPASREGISCAFCHQVHGPVGPSESGGYLGNDSWVSFVSGTRFTFRPEDQIGRFGIGNSGYQLDPSELLLKGDGGGGARVAALPGGVVAHARPSESARAYLRSSEMCGSCHDVRLFGTDVLGAGRGEHFKRLRNGYSEWRDWAVEEARLGRKPASCQDCHMSSYPGVCVRGAPGAEDEGGPCGDGFRFVPRAPGERSLGLVATSSEGPRPVAPHYFTSVDFPLSPGLDAAVLDRAGLDAGGIPLGARARRDLLLRRGVRFALGDARRVRGVLEVPIEIENVGAGHKIPAGFSQERELWVHLRVTDARGRLVYEVGKVDRDDEDLRDKVFLRVNTDPERLDGQGRPLGLFGADVGDGPDVPRWEPPQELGGSRFRGRGLINFQNGFLRCVRCIGELGADGTCLPLAGERHRAERFADADYDLDTGECRSNLTGRSALFETYFPVGSLDADRGLAKAPDTIIDTRALSPGRPVEFVYALDTARSAAPFTVEARLLFRAFPPFLVRAFVDYEARQAQLGRRPSGPHVVSSMLRRIERVELAARRTVVP
ncbi:MAG: hypothetical protein EXR75_16500 [Myxococcales bacterium]|nr:hypothetical protein [Myxococcales bacterium]